MIVNARIAEHPSTKAPTFASVVIAEPLDPASIFKIGGYRWRFRHISGNPIKKLPDAGILARLDLVYVPTELKVPW